MHMSCLTADTWCRQRGSGCLLRVRAQLVFLTPLGSFPPTSLPPRWHEAQHAGPGFYDDAAPQDHFLTDPAFSEPADGTQEAGAPALSTLFPPPRAPGSPGSQSPGLRATVADALKMNKNAVLARPVGPCLPSG